MVAARDIVRGRLVAPFGPEVPVPGRAYYFVCARGQEKRAPIKAFRDWVFAEMEETHATLRAALAAAAGLHTTIPSPVPLSPSPSAVHRGPRAAKTRGRKGRRLE
jgi:hypothetical protein